MRAVAAPLHQDRKPPVGFGARCGDDAFGDLALEHENGAVVPGRPRLDADPARPAARLRCCRADWRRCGSGPDRVRTRVEGERVARRRCRAGRDSAAAISCERGDGALVALDRDDPGGAERQQGARQSAGAGTDLQHRDAGERSRRPGDACGEVEIEQEILAERFLGDETVPANDFAQRRQAVGRVAHDAATAAG